VIYSQYLIALSFHSLHSSQSRTPSQWQQVYEHSDLWHDLSWHVGSVQLSLSLPFSLACTLLNTPKASKPLQMRSSMS